MRQAPGVKQRRADQRSPAGAQRDLREQRRGRVERLGLLAVGPLRRPGRAAREEDDAAPRPRRDEFAGVAAVDELLEGRAVRGETRRPGLGLGPRNEAQAAVRGGADALGELRVADDRAGVLAGADRRDLRAGEGGVEQQRVRAQLGGRDERLDEAAVVATEDRDHVVLADPRLSPRMRECVRAPVHLGEGQLAMVVDDRRRAGVANGRHGVAARHRRTPFAQRPDDAREAVRARGGQHAALGEPARREGLGRQRVEQHRGWKATAAAGPAAAPRGRSARGCRRRGAG